MDDATHYRVEHAIVRESEDGEQIVTPNGIVPTGDGDYIVNSEWDGTTVMTREEFDNSGYKEMKEHRNEPHGKSDSAPGHNKSRAASR